eukprot:GHVS01014113.1.p1 GENE.GHVS01014113.1~~GHVS01014113.1.p1  ORF type:complete len:668 (+),score=129.46 GHVS01014113.1:117-2120(+)
MPDKKLVSSTCCCYIHTTKKQTYKHFKLPSSSSSPSFISAGLFHRCCYSSSNRAFIVAAIATAAAVSYIPVTVAVSPFLTSSGGYRNYLNSPYLSSSTHNNIINNINNNNHSNKSNKNINNKASSFCNLFRSSAFPVRCFATSSLSRCSPSTPMMAAQSSSPSSTSCSPSANNYDLFVIGAGSGGMSCARRAAAYGASVGIGEYQRLGGTCVNVGCVPKKVMWNAANLREMMSQGGHYGLGMSSSSSSQEEHNNNKTSSTVISVDWEKLKKHRDDYVKRLNGIYDNNLKNSKVQLYHKGFCSLDGNGKIRIKHNDSNNSSTDTTIVSADHILIAVGGQPDKLGIKGEEYTIDSDGFFELKQQPKKVAVIGAGYIAVELVGIFNSLGTETHLFVRGECALRKFDEMLKWNVDSDMKKHGVHIHPGSIPESITKDPTTGHLSLHLKNGTTHSGFDSMLVARGRTALVKGLGLEKGNVTTTSTGHVQVDEYQNTTANGVYAVGDVCGKVELTPMAIAAGRRLADRLFGGQKNAKADYEFVPTCIFTHPPIGTVGLAEEEAKEKYGENNLNVYKSSSVNLYYGPFQMAPADKPKTFMKLICLKDHNDRIVGAHVYGMGADEMIQGFGVAIKMGATKTDLDNCVAVHPTAAEEFVTIPPWGLKQHPQPTFKK